MSFEWLPTDATTVQEAAQLYFENGLAPISIYGTSGKACQCGKPSCPVPGKHPRGAGWTEAHARAQAPAVPAGGNVGLLMGWDLVAVDVDGPVGRSTLDALEIEHGQLPPTLTSRSGRPDGGEHRVFRIGPGQDVTAIRNLVKFAPGLDVRSRGGQIVAPPSLHASGTPYRWTERREPAELPQWLYEAMTSTREKSAKPQPTTPGPSTPVTPERLRRARAYAATMDAAIVGARGSDRAIYAANKIAVGFDLDTDSALEVLTDWNKRCEPPWSTPDLRRKITEACKTTTHERGYLLNEREDMDPERAAIVAESAWSATLLRTDKGTTVSCVANVATILARHPDCAGVLGYDEFRGVKVKRRTAPWAARVGDWQDVDVARVRAWLQPAVGVNASTEIIMQAVAIVCADNAFDPLRDELRGFGWDGVSRLPTWLCTYFGAEDTPYVRTIGKRFVVSAVARALRPGCKVDTMPIAEGGQGRFKSSGFRALAGPGYFSDTPIDFRSKDAMSALDGVWLQEIAELESFSRTEASTIKAYTSKQDDQYRPAYGREKIIRLRRTVFVGTTNESAYLRDFTGGRRFWPFACGRVDTEAITRDRGQLLAEAVACFDAGERWWLDEDEMVARLARVEQEQRRQQDPWEQPIADWLQSRRTSVTTYEILTLALQLTPAAVTRAHEMRAAEILGLLGWAKGKRQRREGSRIYPYFPPGLGQVGPEVGTASTLENEGDSPLSLLSQPLSIGGAREIGGRAHQGPFEILPRDGPGRVGWDSDAA